MNKHVLRLYEEISEHYGAKADVVFLADNSRAVFDEYRSDARFFLFDVEDIEALDYPAQQALSTRGAKDWVGGEHSYFNFMPGHVHLPPILYAKAHPDYQHYWIVEYDVRFTGNWADLFSHFENNDADLLGTTLVRRPEIADWHLWEAVEVSGRSLDPADYIRGFYPFCRFSRRALSQLDADYRKGVRGHQECVVATLLHDSGMRIEDIGGDGEFVDSSNINRFYRNKRLRGWMAPGTFVFRPVFETPGREPDMLWHPVKPSPFPVNYIRMLKAAIRANLPVLARFYDRAVKRR